MPAGLQPAPFGHSGTDPRGETIPRSRQRRNSLERCGRRVNGADIRVARMPTFDVVSEVDMQEVRNAVDQANREAGTRFDFKGTNALIEFSEKELSLSATTEDRLRALYQLLEEKLVKRQVSLKTLDAGKIEEASHKRARHTVA